MLLQASILINEAAGILQSALAAKKEGRTSVSEDFVTASPPRGLSMTEHQSDCSAVIV